MTRHLHPSAVDDGGTSSLRTRRGARVDVRQANTQLSPRERYHVEITVRNLSAAGFMAECAEPVRIGSHVALEIPGIGSVDAQVRWQIGAKMGGMFLDPISLDHCEWTAERAGCGQEAIA